MTPSEKLTVETTAALCDTSAGVLKDIAAIYGMLSACLPNLTAQQRDDLGSELKQKLGNAEQLKLKAKSLRSILEQN